MRQVPAFKLLLSLICGILCVGCAVPDSETKRSSAAAPPSVGLRPSLSSVPLLFVENQGQLDPRVAYTVAGRGSVLYFTPAGVTIALLPRGSQEAPRAIA